MSREKYQVYFDITTITNESVNLAGITQIASILLYHNIKTAAGKKNIQQSESRICWCMTMLIGSDQKHATAEGGSSNKGSGSEGMLPGKLGLKWSKEETETLK